MPYKFNSGDAAYTCDRCNVVLTTGWDAVAMREVSEKFFCEECEAVVYEEEDSG